MKLRKEVKDAIQLAIVILVLIMLIGIGLFGMKKEQNKLKVKQK